MKKIVKNFSYILCCLAIASSVSGCSLKRTATTTTTTKAFTVWSFEDEDIWKPYITNLQKNLKGYDIKYIKKSLSDTYENDTLNSILSGQGPDVWAIPNDWVYRHKDKLAAMPDDLVKSSKINLDEKYVPAVKESVYFDNKIYGLTPAIRTQTVFYNSKLFDQTLEEYQTVHRTVSGDSDAVRETKRADLKRVSNLLSQVPSLWSDFVETVKLITKRDSNNITRSGVALGTTSNITESCDILYALMLQNGTQMLSTDLKLANFNLPQNTASGSNDYPAKRALEFYSSFSNPSSANYSWSSAMPQDTEAFANGQVAMIIGDESTADYLAQKYPDFKFKKAPLPQISAEADQISDYATFNALVVPAASVNVSAAWDFVNSIASDSSFASTIRYSTAARKKDFTPALTDREGSSNPGSFQSQTAHSWVKGRYPKDVDAVFREAINNVTGGQLAVQASLDSAATKVTNLLKKENW